MQITRNAIETAAGPREWFTGAVYIDSVATPSGPSRLGAASVHFTPGARTAWHTHPLGQTIYVTEGIGLCQRRGVRQRVDAARRLGYGPPSISHEPGQIPRVFVPDGRVAGSCRGRFPFEHRCTLRPAGRIFVVGAIGS